MLDFTLTLSALYEDLDAPQSRLPLAPSFYRHFFPSPFSASCDSLSDGFITRMPHFAQDYPTSKLFEIYGKAEEATEVVRLRLTSQIMDRMLADLGGPGPYENGVKLAAHDALMAYLVAALNQCLPKPIRRVINIVNVSPGMYWRDPLTTSPSRAVSSPAQIPDQRHQVRTVRTSGGVQQQHVRHDLRPDRGGRPSKSTVHRQARQGAHKHRPRSGVPREVVHARELLHGQVRERRIGGEVSLLLARRRRRDVQ